MSQKLEPVTRDICGEYRGWNAHVRNGESQCDRCKQAAADYSRDRRHRIGESKSKLYTAAEIEDIKQSAAADAKRELATVHLKRRASRMRRCR